MNISRLTIYSTVTELWNGQEELEYPALLILLECCIINICAAFISQKVFSLQNPTAQSAVKVNLAAQIMSHSVAASLSALVATGKKQCTVCYELCSVMKEVANENNEA
jgi:hypothetical protein